MNYYAYLHQEGGCDYTIGCGNLLVKITAKDRAEAGEKLKQLIASEYTGERQLSRVILIEGELVPFPFDIINIYVVEKSKKAQEEKDTKEKEEYLRLKEKFEK
jgi:hypothetical protein